MKSAASNIPQTIIAIYSSNMDSLASYYAEALDLGIKEKGEGYICLGREGFEVNILAMNGKSGPRIEPEKQWTLRVDAPIKCSFLVASLDQVRKANAKYGGGLKDEEQAWEWRGCRHLDGSDPEGNVVQFRVS